MKVELQCYIFLVKRITRYHKTIILNLDSQFLFFFHYLLIKLRFAPDSQIFMADCELATDKYRDRRA